MAFLHRTHCIRFHHSSRHLATDPYRPRHQFIPTTGTVHLLPNRSPVTPRRTDGSNQLPQSRGSYQMKLARHLASILRSRHTRLPPSYLARTQDPGRHHGWKELGKQNNWIVDGSVWPQLMTRRRPTAPAMPSPTYTPKQGSDSSYQTATPHPADVILSPGSASALGPPEHSPRNRSGAPIA
jgi:hypothetical protein